MEFAFEPTNKGSSLDTASDSPQINFDTQYRHLYHRNK